jgi:hypothetical protein
MVQLALRLEVRGDPDLDLVQRGAQALLEVTVRSKSSLT